MNKEQRQIVWNKYDKKCAYCGCVLEYKKMQVDHIHPKSLGGKDHLDNYNPSCRACNFYKSSLTLGKFRFKMKTLHIRLSKIFIVKLAIKFNILTLKEFDKFYFEKLNNK